ncbi:MAG TPA: LysE family translocator [Leucothrix mucor]|uniref:LysE family translocator n=1 Tax=Leucothrix mucor TaxID=45248 RepID=A0A7V2WVI3_LEUMU|nr:LysE family translocator [Leucothrix mucor]
MPFEAAITFFIAIFIFAITPGPGVFAILAHALTAGAKACYPLALGIAISDILYLIMATLGLAAIAENWGSLFTAIRFIGATYLFYLGWKMWTAKVEPNLAANNNTNITSTSWISGFTQGFLISASNPKVILFYITFLPTFMDLSVLNQADIILASSLTLVALMLGLMLIAFSAASTRQQFKSERSIKHLNRTAGGIMMSAGAFLALRR